MPDASPEFVPYQRARFITRLPAGRRYTGSHFWLLEESPGLWRVGFTKFATRMLGELVEYGFSANPADPIAPGQTIGWVEGFKALSDLYAIGSGEFVNANPALEGDITLFDTDPYNEGWLYRFKGEPQPDTVDVQGYIDILDGLIDRLQDKPPSAEC